MSIRLLYAGVDTLEATFEGELVDGLISRLQTAKDRAQLLDRPQPFDGGGEEFFVTPKGSGTYRFVLQDSDIILRVSVAASGIPPVSVRLLAQALATHGHTELYERSAQLAASLGADRENTLSRLDLCLDVQGFEFTDRDFENIVCRASARSIHKDGEGVTYKLGTRNTVFRIYRKDAELKAKKKLSYATVWESAEHYDPDAPVWRIEVQYRRDALRELSADTVRESFQILPGLFAHGVEWCKLCVPSGANKSRWPLDPRWEVLPGLWGASEPQPRIRHAARAESEGRIISRLYGALASLGAS
ncbi:MAG: replication initiation factor domain-containing protein [Coriobacteriia bacterium]|nr:replication initiation factor domain-containing protein [Coriobacteriia bacterium]